LFYQPIDEIRDYFGDEVALYFAWLGVYTRSLVWPSAFGLFTMIWGALESGIDPNKNPLTVVYTLFIAIWSVQFLQRWSRRETELRFLWGSEQIAEVQIPRLEFKGKLKINLVTGRETEVVAGYCRAKLKKVVAWATVMLMCVLTIALALTAESISSMSPGWLGLYDINDDDSLSQEELSALLDDAIGGQQTPFEVEAFLNQSGCIVLGVQSPCIATATGTLEVKEALMLEFPDAKPLPMWQHTNKQMWDSKKWTILAAFGNLFCLQVMQVIFTLVAVKLNDWENHRLQTEYERALVLKEMVFAFVNNYFVM
jgi:hypothetical protein